MELIDWVMLGVFLYIITGGIIGWIVDKRRLYPMGWGLFWPFALIYWFFTGNT